MQVDDYRRHTGLAVQDVTTFFSNAIKVPDTTIWTGMAIDDDVCVWFVFRLICKVLAVLRLTTATSTADYNVAYRLVGLEPEIYTFVEIMRMSCTAVWKARTQANY